jgi:hypothetical protein
MLGNPSTGTGSTRAPLAIAAEVDDVPKSIANVHDIQFTWQARGD